ncbi:uncharacterized protein LOC115793893 [Archocentrus centrarchus]|uniref:uncharacterized protein LOC115793893 n=1 Tax=Archocentrus centrarchus TaxID=63155 RepID=UPI0011E9EEF1|nr:uncharacterized protein LOC115793893 [Archocentrus centrarchus]
MIEEMSVEMSEMSVEMNEEMSELPYLPPEVWLLVFRYLNTKQKHTVRLCCKGFRVLIDHPFLWKDYTVVLTNLLRYPSNFWDTLQYRRVTRAVVQHLWPKDWQVLVKTLPSLTTIVCVKERRRCNTVYLEDLSDFPDLRKLGVRNATWGEPMLVQCKNKHLAAQLTHLSVCNVQLFNTAEFIDSVSHMVNLEYLLFHQQDAMEHGRGRPVPCDVFHKLLLSLKKLKHLSWGMKGEPTLPLPDDYFFPEDPEKPGAYGGPALTTLELSNYTEMILTENTLRGLTSLKSLSIHYRYLWDGTQCHLRSWVNHVPQLDSLTIIGGNFLGSHTINFPPRMTRLTLRTSVCMCQLTCIASKLKLVEYLDIDQNRLAGTLCKQLPILFPQLKTLRIRFCREEPKRELLFLNGLRHLEQLELIMGCSNSGQNHCLRKPWPSSALQGLIRELQHLSKNRFRIMTKMQQRDILKMCDCVCDGF